MIQLMLPLTEDCCVKDTVVCLLRDNQELTAKELWYRIKKFRNVSYHGVYKAVCELRGNEVLDKKQNKYQINRRWLVSLRTFVEKFDKVKQNGQVLP